jgi:hypothetical protein
VNPDNDPHGSSSQINRSERLLVSVAGDFVSSVFSDVRQLFSDVAIRPIGCPETAVHCEPTVLTTEKSEDPRSDKNYVHSKIV